MMAKCTPWKSPIRARIPGSSPFLAELMAPLDVFGRGSLLPSMAGDRIPLSSSPTKPKGKRLGKQVGRKSREF